jgi:hypothetical protein
MCDLHNVICTYQYKRSPPTVVFTHSRVVAMRWAKIGRASPAQLSPEGRVHGFRPIELTQMN